ncbi:hypothetical protein BD309DRAFT_1053148, partial [Dichomitus squalens]
IENYCLVAANVLYVYDYFITLGVEVEFFWNRSFSGAVLLFVGNRYLTLVNVVTDYLQLLPLSAFSGNKMVSGALTLTSCALYQRGGLGVVWLELLPPAVFSCLRAYALSKNWPLALLILMLSLVPFGVNADYGYGLTGYVEPMFGCMDADREPLNISIIAYLELHVSLCLIIADILLIIITWVRLYRRHIFSETSKPLTFERVLIQNGTLYFIILLVMNALHLSFSLAAISGNNGYSDVTAFTPMVTNILVSRFLLDLQRAKHESQHFNTDRSALVSASNAGSASVGFASRVVASIGETLAGDMDVGSPETDASNGVE